MARTDTLEHYLTDVADSIRAKTGESSLISADNFDIAISNIPSGGPSDIYRVATVQEMNALQNVEPNSICVISTVTEGNWTATTSSSSITCPETVELPEEYSVYSNIKYRDTDNTFQLTSYFQHSRFRLEGYGSSDPLMIDVQYSSEDGIHYTRGNFEARNYDTQESLITGDTINLPVALSCKNPGEFEPLVGYFMRATQMTFDGIFTYVGSSWVPTNLGVSATNQDILSLKTAYTNSGLTTGVFGETFDMTLMDTYIQITNMINNWTPTNYKKPNFDPVFVGYSGTELNITKLLDTHLVTTMAYLFYNCSNLTELDVTGFDVSSLTETQNMFYNCANLTELDLSNFNTSSILRVQNMFDRCKKLMRIDIRNLDLTGITTSSYYNNMFGSSATSGVPNNCLIIVKDNANKSWITSKFSRLTNVKTPSEL